MTKAAFQQLADQLKDEAQASDYRADDVTSVPIIRIHQDKTQTPPEGSEPGFLYSPTAGFFTPTKSLQITVLEMVNIRQLWTPWTAKDKHIICKCVNQAVGQGIPYIETDGRWVPGDATRECAACPYNAFRNRSFAYVGPFAVSISVVEPLAKLESNGKPLPLDEHCGSGKLFAGIVLPEDMGAEIALESVLPFFFQVGSSVFGNSYNRLSNSWEAFVVGCKMVKPAIPWMACKLNMTTTLIDTANGPTYAPVFEVFGVHAGLLEKVRVIAKTYEPRLALKAGKLPDIEPDEVA